MVTILVTQCAWTSPSPPNVCLDFWTPAYQVLFSHFSPYRHLATIGRIFTGVFQVD